MHTLYLQATDSPCATEDELAQVGLHTDQLPQGWHLMRHQVQTLQALRRDDAAIVVNRALTGDGKSFAGQLPLFFDRWQTFTMYPTNELARDQERSLASLHERWKPPRWRSDLPLRRTLTAEKLDEVQADLEGSARDHALTLLLDSDLILTNPDIFHLIMNFGYKGRTHAPDLLIGEIAHRYRLFTFDEFHLFGAAQTSSVMIAMLLLREITAQSRPPRFLFLSATPQELLAHFAALIGLPIMNVGGTDYQHGLPEPPPLHRRILERTTLHLHPGRLEDWIVQNVDLILRFYADHRPGAKGAIIANGVATAHRLYALLKPVCDQAGIKLGLNTGLTPKAERARDCDLLIATSTVDVGVDFKINLLIFESVDAASHMQRLGRLGRHKQDEKGNDFNGHYEAHALLPEWVIAGIAEQHPSGSEINREQYRQAIHQAMPALQDFHQYPRHWSGVQAAHVLRELSKFVIKTQYASILKSLETHYKTLFEKSVWKYAPLFRDDKKAILDAAHSFRGGSPFSVLVLDETSSSKEVTAYNLVSLLLSAELDFDEFSLDEILMYAERNGQRRAALLRGNPLGAAKLFGWRTKPRTLAVDINRELNEEEYETVIETKRVRFRVSDAPKGMLAINRTLDERRLAAYLIPDQEVETIRRKLKLGFFSVELFAFRTADGRQGCAAFGRDALLISSIYHPRKSSTDRAIFS